MTRYRTVMSFRRRIEVLEERVSTLRFSRGDDRDGLTEFAARLLDDLITSAGRMRRRQTNSDQTPPYEKESWMSLAAGLVITPPDRRPPEELLAALLGRAEAVDAKPTDKRFGAVIAAQTRWLLADEGLRLRELFASGDGDVQVLASELRGILAEPFGTTTR
jgi:hypothetical protein